MFDENIIVDGHQSNENETEQSDLNNCENKEDKPLATKETSNLKNIPNSIDNALETKSNQSGSEMPSKDEISSHCSSSINKSRDTLNLSYNTNEMSKGINQFNFSTPTQLTNKTDTNTPNTQNVMGINKIDLNSFESEINLNKNSLDQINMNMSQNPNPIISVNKIDKIEITDDNEMNDDVNIKSETDPNAAPMINVSSDMIEPNHDINEVKNETSDTDMKDESDDENDLSDFDESQYTTTFWDRANKEVVMTQ